MVAFSKGTSFLRVSTANFHKDSGEYSCHVKNLAGSENVTFQLTIQGKPLNDVIIIQCLFKSAKKLSSLLYCYFGARSKCETEEAEKEDDNDTT